MKTTQRLLYKLFFAVFLLFTVYGCQTTNSTVTSEAPITERTSKEIKPEAENMEPGVSQTSSLDKEVSATSITVKEKSDTNDRKKKELIEQFGNYFLGRLQVHGGSVPPDVSGGKEAVNRDKQVEALAAKPADTENRPYLEMEKQLYGKWINKLETESYDFLDDGTVAVVVSGQRGKTHTLHGHYKIVEAGRIKIDFRGDTIANQMPPRYFKISISENAFSLTDEPKKKGGPDGPTTKYNRVE